MKPKKNIITLILAVLYMTLPISSGAQKIYFGIGAGYGLSTASQSFFSTDASSATEKKLVKGAFGKGISIGMTIGTMLSSNASAELGISYLKGGKIKSDYTHTGTGYYSSQKIELSANMIRLTPSIKITTSAAKINVYSKAGFVIGVGGKLFDAETYDATSYGKEETVYEWTGGISTGFTGTFGMSIKTGSSACFFSEICFIAQAWAPEKRLMTSYKLNGTDKLSSLSKSETETDFSNTAPATNTNNSNEPNIQLKTFMPMSAVYLNLGFQFSFGNKKKTEAKPATEIK